MTDKERRLLANACLALVAFAGDNDVIINIRCEEGKDWNVIVTQAKVVPEDEETFNVIYN